MADERERFGNGGRAIRRQKRKLDANVIHGRPSIKLRLENFRLFRDSGWFTLSPLTCLVEKNSSGKSSVLSSILLLKQSLEQEGTSWGRGPTPLFLAGQYCDLGGYSDVVHKHDESLEITFSFDVTYKDLAASHMERGVPFVNLSIPRQTGFRTGYYYGGIEVDKLSKRGRIEKLGDRRNWPIFSVRP